MNESFATRLKYYLLWMLPVSAVFFGLYPAINIFTTARNDTLALWLPVELSIPFIPAFIWVYLSMYLIILVPLFFLNLQEQKRLAITLMGVTIVGAIIFLLFPARLGFVRQLPDDPLYHMLFALLLSLDRPHNLVPSLHVAWSYTVVLAITRRPRGWISPVLYLWFIAIGLSTLLIHQHHLLDVVTGFLLSLLVFYFTGKVYEKNRLPSVNPHQS
ncbi:phosphatase PAP2 family protein [Citrobacter youngae]|uniref:PAP2 family protein n=1 Tax=Citrobacter youngae ATCC 29220 TaxID=500640 RepID=D4BAV6_9ENTR|nr:phosphatase PAP2 family protein [Citrobacter youngae]EFE09317.1 PAP2 family protein [Citrobacter youngae ATCC 29220]